MPLAFAADDSPTRRCARCHRTLPHRELRLETSREVDGRTFDGHLAARECTGCGLVQAERGADRRFTLLVARTLADAGASSGEVFRFLRKAVGLRATELAGFLNLAPETISRWETNKRAVDRAALALLGNAVRDLLDGRSTTLDGLRALSSPRTLASKVPIGAG